ncbi:MAG: ABC transporter ATP-binding protein [Solirubrobacterales bacterium]|nr:ABC transporter ATP-binding protein [Solirubrobacterales bacterium]
MSEPAIALTGLGRAYGERWALRDLTLELGVGQTLVVFGPNGAGKSTLLRVLATLARPQAGEARVLGKLVPKQGWAVRAKLGFLAHDPLLYRDLTARENLTYHARLYGVKAQRIDELLEAVEMTKRADEPVRTLSRGMVQRMAVCRTVLHSPELLLLDEPVANLDPAATALVSSLVGPTSGTTRVVTSHDPVGGLEQADIALGLRDGRPVLLAPASEVSAADIGALYS